MDVMEGYNLFMTSFTFEVNTFDKPDQYVEDSSYVLAVKFDYAEHHRYCIHSAEDNINTQVHHSIKKEEPHVSRFTLANFKSDEDGEWKDYLYNSLDSLKIDEEDQDEVVDKIIEEFNKEIESLGSDNNDRKILALSVDMKLTHFLVCEQDLIARELRKRMLKRVRVVKEEELEEDQYQESRKRRKIISEGESCCSICLDEFVAEKDDVFSMPCSHVFHGKECIVKWLKENDSCPVCRFQLHVC